MRRTFQHCLNALKRRLMSPEKYARSIGVKIGIGCKIDTKQWPTEPYLIQIGDYVRIAKGTSFYTHGGLVSLRKYYNDYDVDQFGKIVIGDYSYIGENCMVMQGVSIGERCIVGGGSVLTKSVPDGVMVAGNPAKFIGYSEDFYNRVKATNNVNCKGKNKAEKKAYLLSLPDSFFPRKPYVKVPEGK